ncbi:MAG: hypothetical protein GXY68_07720, partial [Chloroflexi bacterium]|nr:hypothetical protein [Chloroflexota bacterium]
MKRFLILLLLSTLIVLAAPIWATADEPVAADDATNTYAVKAAWGLRL